MKPVRGIAVTALALAWWCIGSAVPAQGQADERVDPAEHYDEVPVMGSAIVEAEYGEPGRPPTRGLRRDPERLIPEYGIPVPSDPLVDPSKIGPKGPATLPPVPGAPRAPGDFEFFHDVDLSDADTGNPGGWPREPTAATFGRMVLLSGNTFGALSTDGGTTWTNIDPDDEFEPDVCCDQIVYYERTRGLFLWLMQGNVDGDGENVYRIAVAVGQQNFVDRNWFWYNLDPQVVGGFADGVPWDFPSFTCSDNYMWFTTNGIGTGQSIMARAQLDDVADGTSTTFEWSIQNIQQVRLINGATGVMYAAGHVDNNTMRVYRWPESGAISGVDRDVDAWNNGNSSAPGPDGLDWFSPVENSTHKVRGAVATPSEIYFFWSAAQGGGFDFPQVQAARFTRNDARTYNGTEVVWSPINAWAYASASANDAGHLGGTIAFGGGDFFPSSAAWIADDINGVTIAPLETRLIRSGTDGPAGDRWGDYLATLRHVPYGNTWVGTAFTLQGGSGSTRDVVTYTWFGRERDAPPPFDAIHVDLANTSGHETGEAAHPFNTVVEGHTAATAGDTIVIHAGTYDETLTFTTPCFVTSVGGSAIIR